uniref:Peptidase S1 domain-containing protein n=1 Tax=Naja naja TaxID=35670 RepID=A0A8C6VIR1_NAJNA
LQPSLSGLCFAAGIRRTWVIGGKEVTPHSRPFMASIQHENKHICGGFLLRRRWVMTAAHCFRVILGAHSLKTQEASQQIFGIKNSIAHPLFNSETVRNDIRLLKLNRSAIFNKNVRKIKLPHAYTDLCPGLTSVSAGGPPSSMPCPRGEHLSPHDQRWNLLTGPRCQYAQPLCLGQIEPKHVPVYPDPYRIQTTGYHREGITNGDSGGPLVCGENVHGIVSFNGKRCGDRQFPDVYTRIANYIPWIRFVLQTF